MAQAAEFPTCTLDLRQSEINGDGLETSDCLSIKMIDNKKRSLQSAISGLEKRLGPLSRQRQDLTTVADSVGAWIQLLHDSDRGKSGIPVLESVKDRCDEITPALLDDNSAFSQAVQRLHKANVPGWGEVEKCVHKLQGEVEGVFAEESTYNGKFVEDTRELMGRARGICHALLQLYY